MPLILMCRLKLILMVKIVYNANKVHEARSKQNQILPLRQKVIGERRPTGAVH